MVFPNRCLGLLTMPDKSIIPSQSKTILYVVNSAEFFLSHRLPIALACKAAGYEVHVATPAGKGVQSIRSRGFYHHEVLFARSGQNPIVELKALIQVIRLFKNISPDLVHLVTIKPIIYGGIAANLMGVKSVVAALSGLGTVFLAKSLMSKLRAQCVLLFYKIAFLRKRLVVIFQNPDDREALLSHGCMQTKQTRLIRGSGVALADYPFVPEPKGKTIVVMAARLLKDKGVSEYAQASLILCQRGIDVEMRLIGTTDLGNPTTVTKDELEQWQTECGINLMGFREDIASQYAAANIVCLPSYREGLPKSLIEAAACGRAVITTDVPGCRDSITPNVTGLLIPVKNASALADAIQNLVQNPSLRHQMGAAGRRLAEEAFAIEKIVAQHLDIYDELMTNV